MPEPNGRLMPPPKGVTVRMYRIGHGDCFLLAFPPIQQPVYVLIDCGYKPGSPERLTVPTTSREITDDIRQATDGRIDVVVITHEHQDHVNGITEKNFKDIQIEEAWFAWTEDPYDDLANKLRSDYYDQLLGILNARMRLQAAGDQARADKLDDFLAFELGGDEDTPFTANLALQLLGANGNPANSVNKRAMKLIKDRAKVVRYLRPHGEPLPLPRNHGCKVFTLGPPRDKDKIKNLDPESGEQFHLSGFANRSARNYFAAAAKSDAGGGEPPFTNRYALKIENAPADPFLGDWFKGVYGSDTTPETPPRGVPKPGEGEATGNPGWRRIDRDWLYSAELLALDMNNETNNSSLVLAFELEARGKVLLFAADAQRGNWLSWKDGEWNVAGGKVTARDLLSRTVLYKVGHHGSHNATLNGKADDEYPNLAWMAQNDYSREFVAFITAVRAWAETQKGWDHPKKAIKDAIVKRTGGRVFQTDTEVVLTDNQWAQFQGRIVPSRLFFDYMIEC